MAKFKYKFQNFLSLKEKMEEQKKLEYGKSLAALSFEKDKLLSLVKEKENNILTFKNHIQKKFDASAFISYNNYIDFISKCILFQQDVVKTYEKMAEEKRLELLEAVKERKMFEKLKEKDLENYFKEEQISEQKIIDEIVSYGFHTIPN